MYACYKAKDIIKYVVEQKALNKGWLLELTLKCVFHSKYRLEHLAVNLAWVTFSYIAYLKAISGWNTNRTLVHDQVPLPVEDYHSSGNIKQRQGRRRRRS